MTRGPDFGDLRSLLNQPHTPQVWDQLCLWVDQWQDETSRHRIMPYIEGHLQNWTDEQRRVPRAWIKTMNEGKNPSAWMFITRALNLRGFNRQVRSYYNTNSIEFPVLCKNEALKHIHYLDIGDNILSEQDIVALSQCEHFDALTHLELQRNTLSVDELEKILVNKTSSLVYLGLRKCKLNDEHIERLSANAGLSQIQHLDVFGNELNMHSINVLSQGAFRGVHNLNLGNNPNMSSSALNTFDFPNLHTLNLERYPVSTGEFAILLGERTYRHLHLWDTELENIGDVLRTHHQCLQEIHTLNLGKNKLNNDDISALAEIPFQNLTSLNLYDNQIGPAGAIALANTPWLEQLTELSIGKNSIGSKGKKAIQDTPLLSEEIKNRL